MRYLIHGVAAARRAEKNPEIICQAAMQQTTMNTTLLPDERMVRIALRLQMTVHYIPDTGSIE